MLIPVAGMLLFGAAPRDAGAACLPLPSAHLHALDEQALNDPAAAIKQAEQQMTRSATRRIKAELFALIADASTAENRAAEAAAAIASGRALLPGIDDPAVVSRLQSRYALTEANSASGAAQLKSAVEALTRVQPAFGSASIERACLLVTRGYLYAELDQLDLAAADELPAYALAERFGWPEVRASAAFELATIYQRTGLLDDALLMIDECIQWTRTGHHLSTLAIAESTRGQVLLEQRKFAGSLAEFVASRRISVDLGDQAGAAYADFSICDAMIKSGNLPAAARACAASAAAFSREHMTGLVILVRSYQAHIDLAQGSPAAALAKLDAILADPRQELLPRYQAKISHDRSRALEALGRSREALLELRRYEEMTAQTNLTGQARTAGVLNARFKAQSIVAANDGLRRQITVERQQALAERTAARWAFGFAVLATVGSLLLALILVMGFRHRRAARRQELVLRTLASNAPDSLLLLDADGCIRFANRPLFGNNQVPQIGEKLIDWVPAQAREECSAALERVTRARTASQFDVRLQDADRGARSFEQHLLPIVEGSRLVGATLRSTEVTETQRLQLEVMNVALRERDRFSSEVHEGLGQELVGIALLLESARRLKPEDAATLDARLAEVIHHLNRTIQIARDLAHGLSPIQIERGSLGAALTRLATELSGRWPVAVRCSIEAPELEIGLPVADYLYRCAREAVTNAMRHGGATEIRIDLRIRDGNLRLAIEDNGTGMRENASSGGLGLRMIAHRARLIGGTLQIKPAGLGGTSISVSVPLTRLKDAQDLHPWP